MTNSTIDSLVADLRPTRPLRPFVMYLGAGAATLVAILLVATRAPMRPDIVALQPAEIVLMRSGALLLLGIAALVAVGVAARPAIGQRSTGWRWALAAAALFPAVSLLLAVGGARLPSGLFDLGNVTHCVAVSAIAAAAIGTTITLWLRRGAPVNLARAGWLTGFAAGALGTFAYNLFCPTTTVHHVAVWYSLAVLVSAVAWRLVLPRLIRW